MEKDMQEKIFQKLLDWANNAEAFASEQIPLLVQELLRWKFYENLFYLFLSILLFFGSCKLFRWAKKEDEDGNDVSIPSYIFSMIGLTLGVLGFIGFSHALIQIHFAPRIFLLEYLKDLLK